MMYLNMKKNILVSKLVIFLHLKTEFGTVNFNMELSTERYVFHK